MHHNLIFAGYGNFLVYKYNNNFFEKIFLGIIIITFLVTLIHFFFKISFYIAIGLLFIGLILFLRNHKSSLTKLYKSNLLYLIIFLILLPIYISQKYHEDFGYYHLPYVITMIEEKIIFGLANGNSAFAHNSIWLNILPIFYINENYDFFFKTNLKFKKFSIGTGGRIVRFGYNKLLFTIGHLDFLDEIQDPNHLAGKIISIDKHDKSFELVSLGHRNHQGLFYFSDKLENQFIISSEHGPKGGDEINVNNLKNDRVINFGWPIASYGINYDGSNPFKNSHEKYGFKEPLVNFTPSIGISEISVVSDIDSSTIYASSLRAKSIYIVKTNKEFSEVTNLDRLIFDHRIRDLKYEETLGGFLVIFENTPSVGFIKAMINN